MQVIGMMGYVDKYDFAINLARTINIMDKAVLVVDATLDQKIKCVVPSLDNMGRSYVTQYNNIDFAVGFDSMHDVENYMVDQGINISLYDYIIIDIDSPKGYEFFRTRGIDKLFFFVDTSILSVVKNKDLIKAIRVYNPQEEDIKITKVLYKTYMSRAAEEYFETQISSYNVKWQEPEYEVQLEEQDKLVDIDSQFSGLIDIKKHTKTYIGLISDLTSQIIEDVTSKEVTKQIKRRRD
ncbi:MAG: hypothetical protein RSE00_00955 [Clostridia bacterium]